MDGLEFEECGTTRTVGLRITFGERAIRGQFPWVVSLVYKNFRGDRAHLCGGALISRDHVVTAAHCLAGTRGYNLDEVLLGQNDLKGEGGRLVSVSEAIPHPAFTNYPVAQFDIAILKLSESVEFTDYIRPICLTNPQTAARSTQTLEEEEEGQDSIVAGWGRTEVGWSSDFLLFTHLTTLNNTYCSTLYQRAIQQGRLGPIDEFSILESQLCAAGEEKSDSCNGDSGGPIFTQHEDERWYLLGVVSFGTNTCDSSLPGVYSRLTSFIPWLLANL